jgi:hypothetical protein
MPDPLPLRIVIQLVSVVADQLHAVPVTTEIVRVVASDDTDVLVGVML